MPNDRGCKTALMFMIGSLPQGQPVLELRWSRFKLVLATERYAYFLCLAVVMTMIMIRYTLREGCVPTVPSTPLPSPPKAKEKAAASAMARPLMDAVPDIAPTPWLGYVRLPLSAETLAKIHLGKYLEREGRGREKDGLPVSGWECPFVSWVVDSDEDSDEEDSK